MNVLHLITDEKFFNFVDEIFKSLPEVTNRYVAHVRDPSHPLVHIRGLKLWRVVGRPYFLSSNMIDDLNWCDCLLIHCLSPAGARMVLKAPQRVTVVWSAWGMDYSSFLVDDEQNLLTEDTRKILAETSRSGYFAKLVGRGQDGYRKSKRYAVMKYLILPSIERFDFFSAPIPDDFNRLRNSLGTRFHADYVQLYYGSVQRLFQPGPEWVTGQDILVGNSGAVTNNHADVFQVLAKKKLLAQKIVVPLSYGYSDHRGYREAVIELGHHLLGHRFDPILNFMSLQDYNALIARCSTVIMNQRRQQAVGNIGAMLFKGARVFLDERNSAYLFLRNRGARIFSMKELSQCLENTFEPLSDAERIKNRHVLQSFWGHDVVLASTRNFIRTVFKRGNGGV